MRKAKQRQTPASPPLAGPRARLKRVGYWAAVGGVWCLTTGLVAAFILALGLPPIDPLPAPGRAAPSVIIRDARGGVLLRDGPEVGDPLRFAELPDALVHAFLAIEDRRFFQHGGLDARGLARAAVVNARHGGVRAGGSTITQQLAKNLFLSPERTLVRKAREAMLALWLESAYSKEEILAAYLNRVYFGAGAYGVDAAARKYFGHSARRLSLPEAALLAGLVKAPSRLAPHRNPEGAWTRARAVLRAMADVGILTPVAAEKMAAQPPAIRPLRGDQAVRYATDWVKNRARALVPNAPATLVIDTTLDTSLQATAASAVERALAAAPAARRVGEAALVAMGFDGSVRALIGGRNYLRTSYNRAVQARRQPGSTFKLFTYLAALEAGLSPDDRYVDGPTRVGDWAPKNYNGRFAGPMTAREAFARSINTVAVQVNEATGRSRTVAMAERLGIRTPVQPIASLPLGTEEVRLLDLTAAYAAIGAGGLEVHPYVIIEIRDRDGEILYRRAPASPRPVLAHPVVSTMTDMLSAVITEGSGRRARLDRPAAGKSGTTQDNRDALFVGFTSELAAGIWLGNDDGTPMVGVTGGSLPALLWRDFMIDAHAGLPVRPLLADSLAGSRRTGALNPLPGVLTRQSARASALRPPGP